MTDVARNIRLHLGSEARQLASARGDFPHIRRIPRRSARAAQRIAVKAGLVDWERSWLRPLIAARHRLLGEAATGPPRFLIRVDEFPYYSSFDEPTTYGLTASSRFHDIMAEARVPHLMSIIPQLTHRPMDPEADGGRPLGSSELALIDRMRRDGVVFAQHGTTHRTRYTDPRRRSEFLGLSRRDAGARIDRGRELLRQAGIEPRVFVAPFNRFGMKQYAAIAERFDVIGGGPETIALMGFHGGPSWFLEAVYVPCYFPLYARAHEVIDAAERIIDMAPGTWIPIVLHMGWEVDDGFRSLPRLAARIAPYAATWSEFLAAVDASRGA